MAARTSGSLQSGFALPTVLIVISILGVVLLGAALSLDSYRDRAREALEDAEFQRRALNAEAYIVFLAMTQPFDPISMDVSGTGTSTSGDPLEQTDVDAFRVMMDNRAYFWNEAQTDGQTTRTEAQDQAVRLVMRLQDEAGLFNFARADLDPLTYLFNMLGMDETLSPTLAQEVIDYNSTRTAPVQPMRTLSELYSLPSAGSLTAAMRRKIGEIAVFQPNDVNQNINTAPSLVLQSWFNMAKADADAAVQNRVETLYTNVNTLGVTPPASTSTLNFISQSGRFRLILTDPRTGKTMRETIVLTPTNTTRPYWIENTRSDTQSITPETELTDAQALPAIPDPAA